MLRQRAVFMMTLPGLIKSFRVGTWNIDSLTGRSGELVEALAERQMDVACVQETRWRGTHTRLTALFRDYPGKPVSAR